MFKHIGMRIALVWLALLFLSGIYITFVIQEKQTIIGQDIEIPSGASSAVIASILTQHHIITSKPIFRWLTRWQGVASQLKPGFYHFEGALNMLDVSNSLYQGNILQFKVTIPEGLRMDEILHLLARKTNTPHTQWQSALRTIVGDMEPEGLWLPETYHYTKPIQAKLLLQHMFDARLRVEQQIRGQLSWNEAQVRNNRIIASIIEKETALPHERALVSAVIHNRLRLHMPLQMDPTVIYGLYRTQGDFSGNITRKDLKTTTPWNTYTNRGLPPTPICNPGEESLRAAAFPADVDYLYFVADGRGGHAFAATLEAHNANVKQWIKLERDNNHTNRSTKNKSLSDSNQSVFFQQP